MRLTQQRHQRRYHFDDFRRRRRRRSSRRCHSRYHQRGEIPNGEDDDESEEAEGKFDG